MRVGQIIFIKDILFEVKGNRCRQHVAQSSLIETLIPNKIVDSRFKFI